MRTLKTIEESVQLALGVIDGDIVRRFAENPVNALVGDLNLAVSPADYLADRRNGGGACDGMSFLEDGVILYAPTESRRQNFTLGHELGHWLVSQADDSIYDWLSAQPDGAVAEETLCDRIAQKLLLPDEVIDSVIGAGPVEARHIADLFEASNASQPVCGIALASRLPALGAVVIVDRTLGEVEYASIHPHPMYGWPRVHPWPGTPAPAGHPLVILQAGTNVRRRSFWTDKWGNRAEFYLDAFAGSRRAVGVLADADLWQAEVFHPPTTREYRDQPQRQVTCCGDTHTVRGYSCPTCRQPYCPICKGCRCDRQAAAEKRCAGPCGLQMLPHLLENGVCEECR